MSWRHLVSITLLLGFQAQAAEEINVYSARQAHLIEPIVQQFTQQSGIKVNLVYAEDGLAERLKREGKLTPADLVLTVDISRLMELVEGGLVQPVSSPVLEQAIPPSIGMSRGAGLPSPPGFAISTAARSA